MSTSEEDLISSMRRQSKTFRFAFRELQRTGWYHDSNDRYSQLQSTSHGNFIIHDGPCSFHGSCDCLFVLEVSNGRKQASTPIGITFDIEADTFQLNEDCLHRYQKNPPFNSICDLVEYYQKNVMEILVLDNEDEFGNIIIYNGDPDAIDGMFQNSRLESQNKYLPIVLDNPILKKKGLM